MELRQLNAHLHAQLGVEVGERLVEQENLGLEARQDHPPKKGEARRALTFFAVNRHGGEALDLDLDLQGFSAARVADQQVMTDVDLEAVNTLNAPLAVAPRKGSDAEVKDGRLTAMLPPYSYQIIRLALA